MTSHLLDLTATGSVVTVLVWMMNEAVRKRMRARWRRLWWIAIPIAFLVPIRIPILPDVAPPLPWTQSVPEEEGPQSSATPPEEMTSPSQYSQWLIIWSVGAIIYIAIIVGQTVHISRKWSRQRLSTQPLLLNLLEDCKLAEGITAPIGIVVTQQISTPAILGWLRPRILLPTGTEKMPHEQIRGILLHELAHFRSLDIPISWLFTAASAVHWFNPLVYIATIGWHRFREEAADEVAIRWMDHSTPELYEEALISILKENSRISPPFGSLAIGESFKDIKRRFIMIKHHHTQTICTALGIAVVMTLLSGAFLRPAIAEPVAPASINDENAAEKANAVQAYASMAQA